MIAPRFSEDQLEFISLLHAFGQPTHISTVRELSPLSYSSFFDLLKQCEGRNWIQCTNDGIIGLGSKFPSELLENRNKLKNPRQISTLLNQIKSKNLSDKIDTRIILNLYSKADITENLNSIIKALQNDDHNTFLKYYNNIMYFFKPRLTGLYNDDSMISKVLELSLLCFYFGKWFSEATTILKIAKEIVQRKGDRRHYAIINLHLGRLLYYQNELSDSNYHFRLGQEIVDELGDDDIIIQSSESLAFYSFLKGEMANTFHYYSTFIQFADTSVELNVDGFALGLCAYSEACLGKINNALGRINYYMQVATEKSNFYTIPLLRSFLGAILFTINQISAAKFHFEKGIQEALAQNNVYALYINLTDLSCVYLKEGLFEESLKLWEQAIREVSQIGLEQRIFVSYVLECLFEAERRGHNLPPKWRFEAQFKKIISGPDITLRGTALRLRAVQSISEGESHDYIWQLFKESEEYLIKSGDVIQLAKTWVEMAHLKAQENKFKESKELIKKAQHKLSCCWNLLFPNQVTTFQDTPSHFTRSAKNSISRSFEKFWEYFVPGSNANDSVNLMLYSVIQKLQFERAAIFQLSNENSKDLVIRASLNISSNYIASESFVASSTLVTECLTHKKPIAINIKKEGTDHDFNGIISIVCIPIKLSNNEDAVLYCDSIHLNGIFEMLNDEILNYIGNQVSTNMKKIQKIEQTIDGEIQRYTDKHRAHINVTKNHNLIFESKNMKKLLSHANRLAKYNTTLLIFGETGTGKEVMARYIHNNSNRFKDPFIIVDASVLPSTLIESELFGHEKGAFTGATQRKYGLIELANKGTLFIDEIGEIQPDIQVKLLRVLQEKNFSRIGGTQRIESDFRLLAATNRDLHKEMHEGRFREDLYYRINVTEIIIPPLRERKEDIILIARHFLASKCRKYNRPKFHLTPEHEEILINYSWPGNVRELKNVMERAVLISDEGHLKLGIPTKPISGPKNIFADCPTLDELQRRYIQYVLSKTGGRIGGPGGASEILGMKRTSVHSRMKKLGI